MRHSRFHLPERFKSNIAFSVCALLMTGLIVVAWKVLRPAATSRPGHNIAELIKKRKLVASLGAALPPAQNGAQHSAQSGKDEETKVPGDYDGDGEIDEAIWRASDGYWVIQQSSDKQTRYISWGMSGDMPVPDDYDGDQKTDLAVWRPSDGVWYVIQSSNGALNLREWGERGDRPVPADYDEDGKLDLAVWRTSENAWLILRSSDGAHMRLDGQKG